MSILVHRCRCGIADYDHNEPHNSTSTAAAHGCRLMRTRVVELHPEPEVIPSWTFGSTGEPSPLLAPGSPLAPGGLNTCTCDQCVAAYQDVS